MFGRLFSRDAENFAIDLARDFSGRCPTDMQRKGAQPVIGLAKAIDDICNRAAEFQRGKRLGIYGRAKFGTAFKLQLQEAGYDSEFVDELTRRLLISMSGR